MTSKKGLAGRVRRIMQDKCASPHSGRRWSLAAVVLAGCLAIGIAFAQTRPSPQAGTIKTKLSRLASIEQPTSRTMIKGWILDPNNEPAEGARIVALPATTYGVRANDEDGYFEILWSSTWTSEGQTVCLVAMGNWRRNEAGFVEVHDPTSPVTIHLEPGVSLTGQVLNPNGQAMHSTVILSLARPFRCQAPIDTASGRPHRQGRFTFSKLPCNQTYKLSIRAEGYQPTELTVDAKDRSKDTIDIGTVVLQPQDPANPVATELSLNPELQEEFHQLYRLDEGQVIKLIKPPFPLGRHEEALSMDMNLLGLHIGGQLHVGFHWDGEPKIHRAHGGGRSRLDMVLRLMLRIPPRDFNVPKELNVLLPIGDWVVREESLIDEQLMGLEEIIYAELHRPIRFEKRTAERDTIIVTGRYAFTPLSEQFPDRLCVFADDKSSLREREADSLPDLWRQIADGIGIAIENRSEPIETAKIRYGYDRLMVSPLRDKPIDMERDLPLLLDNLARQTGLQFKLERQPAQMWFVTEAKSD